MNGRTGTDEVFHDREIGLRRHLEGYRFERASEEEPAHLPFAKDAFQSKVLVPVPLAKAGTSSGCARFEGSSCWSADGGTESVHRGKQGEGMTYIRLAIFLACFTAPLISGCSEVFGSGYDYGRIEVIAVDQLGEPVFGVPLTLYGKGRHYAYGTTNPEGRHVFEFVPFGKVGEFGGFGVEAGAPEGYRFDPGPTRHLVIDRERGAEVTLEFLLERLSEAPAQATARTAPVASRP